MTPAPLSELLSTTAAELIQYALRRRLWAYHRRVAALAGTFAAPEV
jgi:hypothetical protein